MVQPALHTLDGLTLPARWWEASRPRGTVVVLVHGFAGSKDQPAVLAVAESLTEAGHDVLSYDARGHHGSGGLCTLGDLERHDVAAAVEIARERTDRVVLVGASMGAIAALRHAAADPDLVGVVAVSSPSLWRLPRTATTMLAAAMTRTSLGRRVAARRFDVRVASRWTNPEPPVALAARITAPLAILHGEHDRFISHREAIELAGAAGGRCRLMVVRGMGHAFDPVAIPAIRSSIDWTLAQGDIPA